MKFRDRPVRCLNDWKCLFITIADKMFDEWQLNAYLEQFYLLRVIFTRPVALCA